MHTSIINNVAIKLSKYWEIPLPFHLSWLFIFHITVTHPQATVRVFYLDCPALSHAFKKQFLSPCQKLLLIYMLYLCLIYIMTPCFILTHLFLFLGSNECFYFYFSNGIDFSSMENSTALCIFSYSKWLY